MSTIDPADAVPCATCGRRWTDVDGGRNWLHLELTRHDEGDGFDFLGVDFCSQEHAADWLRQPLPEPVPATRFKMTWRDRLDGAAFGLSLGLVCALAGVGFWTTVRFLFELF